MGHNKQERKRKEKEIKTKRKNKKKKKRNEQTNKEGLTNKQRLKKVDQLFPPGLEPRTFRVLGERDNHYTTETVTTLITAIENSVRTIIAYWY